MKSDLQTRDTLIKEAFPKTQVIIIALRVFRREKIHYSCRFCGKFKQRLLTVFLLTFSLIEYVS